MTKTHKNETSLPWNNQNDVTMTIAALYTVNHKKTWQFIFDYNFG